MSVNIGGTKIPGLTYPVLNQGSEVYINSDFLDTYVEIVHPEDTTWADGRDPDAGLLRGQIYIESLYYQGQKHWHYQILQWPRYPVYDKNDFLVDAQQTPYDIFNAAAEAAYYETKEPGILQPKETDSDLYPIQSTDVKAGSVSSSKSFDTEGKKVVKSDDRLIMLKSYLDPWTVQHGISIPLART